MRDESSAAPQYRAVLSTAYDLMVLDPDYATLEQAQQRCVDELTLGRTAIGESDPLEVAWDFANLAGEGPLWRMLVQTPRLRKPVTSGYEVTLAGSAFDPAE